MSKVNFISAQEAARRSKENSKKPGSIVTDMSKHIQDMVINGSTDTWIEVRSDTETEHQLKITQLSNALTQQGYSFVVKEAELPMIFGWHKVDSDGKTILTDEEKEMAAKVFRNRFEIKWSGEAGKGVEGADLISAEEVYRRVLSNKEQPFLTNLRFVSDSIKRSCAKGRNEIELKVISLSKERICAKEREIRNVLNAMGFDFIFSEVLSEEKEGLFCRDNYGDFVLIEKGQTKTLFKFTVKVGW
jgi:hypothetical protein